MGEKQLPFFCSVSIQANTTQSIQGFWHVWAFSMEAERRCLVLQEFVMAEPAACVSALLYAFVAYGLWYTRDVNVIRRSRVAMGSLFVLCVTSLCYHTLPGTGFRILQMTCRRVLQIYMVWILLGASRPILKKAQTCCIRSVHVCRITECWLLILSLQTVIEAGINMDGYVPNVTLYMAMAIEIQVLISTTFLLNACLVDRISTWPQEMADAETQTRRRWWTCSLYALLLTASWTTSLTLHPLLSLFAEVHGHVWTSLWAWYAIQLSDILYAETLVRFSDDSVLEPFVESKGSVSQASEGMSQLHIRRSSPPPSASSACCCNDPSLFLVSRRKTAIHDEQEDDSKPYLDQPRSFTENSITEPVDSTPLHTNDFWEKRLGCIVGWSWLWGYMAILVSLVNGKILFLEVEVWQIVMPAIVGALLADMWTPYWLAIGYFLPVWLPWTHFVVLTVLILMIWLLVSGYQSSDWPRSCGQRIGFFLLPIPCWFSSTPPLPDITATTTSLHHTRSSTVDKEGRARTVSRPHHASVSVWGPSLVFPRSNSRTIPIVYHIQPTQGRTAVSLPSHLPSSSYPSPSSVVDVRPASVPDEQHSLPLSHVPPPPPLALPQSL